MVRLTFEVEGFVTADEEGAEGDHLLTLEGQSVATESEESWTLMLNFVRPPTESGAVSEGELTLVRPDGEEIYASVMDGSVGDLAPTLEDLQRSSVELDFELGEPGEALPEQTGAVRFQGIIMGDQFRGALDVRLD